MDRAYQDITVLLAQVTKGDQQADSNLIPLVYDELRRLVGSYMSREWENHTLQSTALVHEAYLKLVQHQSVDWQDCAHFFGIAAQVMRHILVDHARGHGREKRGAWQQLVSLEESFVFSPEKSTELLELDESLQRASEARLASRQNRRAALLRWANG